MNFLGLNGHDAPFAVSGRAAGLLRDERERIGFVKQPELAARMAGGGRIEKNAALEQRAMKVRDQRPDVTGAVFPAQRSAAQTLEIILIFLGETSRVRFVDRIIFALIGHADAIVAQDESSDVRVKRKSEYAAPGGVHKNGGGTVD